MPQQEPSQPTSTTGGDLSPDEVRRALGTLLECPCLVGSAHLCRILRFLVEQALAGQSDRLKEYVVGIEALGRPATFDPRSDAVVRVQARRLRGRLAEHYRTHGRFDPVRIDLPKGHYVPAFSRQTPASEGPGSGTDAARGDSGPDGTHGPWRARRRLVACGVLGLVVLAIVAGTIVHLSRPRRPPTIAILPFTNVSADPDNDYFCYGLVEELTTALAQSPGLRVVARTSSAQFRRGGDAVDIGRRLGTAFLVEGSVQRVGDRLSISAQLIDTRDGTHVWARGFDRDVRDTIATQHEVAATIGAALQQRLGQSRVGGPPRDRPAPPGDAAALYWRGRYVRDRRGPDYFARSIALYRQAIARHPSYAEAHAWLGEALASEAFHETVPRVEHVEQARTALQRALALDPDLAEAHASLAWIAFFHDRHWRAAEEGLRRAIALDPGLPRARVWYALGLAAHGRADESIAEMHRAVELDPLRYTASNELSTVLYCAHRFEDAMAHARRGLDLDPAFHAAHVIMGDAALGLGDTARGLAEYRAALESMGSTSEMLARIARAQALAGQHAPARRALADLEARAARGEAAWAHVAWVQAALGQPADVAASLDRAAARHEGDVTFARVDPAFDRVRQDPRVRAALGRLD